MAQVRDGRIPMNDAEHLALDQLLAQHGERAGVTRRDPGDTGPLLVEVGEMTFLVHNDGVTEQV